MKTITYDETKYKLMPIEPTSEMLVRGGEEFFDSARNWKIGSTLRDQDHAGMIYEGMLAVAPTPPAVEQTSAQDREDAAILRVTVARAICIADGADPDQVIWQGNPPEPYGDVLGEYLGHADAAIAAIDAARKEQP